jgi:hypothetical protein
MTATIISMIDAATDAEPEGVTLADFRAYMPRHCYIFTPTGEAWPAASVNARIPPVRLFKADGTPDLDESGNQKTISASKWLDERQAVEQMTWTPGLPMLIANRLCNEGGWIDRNGVSTFNLYRPPTIVRGDATKAGKWRDHVVKVYPEDHVHIIRWLAHRVQRPEEKLNHALVFGGAPGIGKDTILEPVRYAIGPWNFRDISPKQMMGRFNGFLRSVILRANEARDLGEFNRYEFYETMKPYTAAPPDFLWCDEKNKGEYPIQNACGVIITTNHKTDGIYLPADDRRHFVAWSDSQKEDFSADYWAAIWNWYEAEGNRHVAAYLAQLDISAFDPKAPPPKTKAFWAIVDANRAPEDAELADVLDRMQRPMAMTLDMVRAHANGISEFSQWLNDRRYRRMIPHRLENLGKKMNLRP